MALKLAPVVSLCLMMAFQCAAYPARSLSMAVQFLNYHASNMGRTGKQPSHTEGLGMKLVLGLPAINPVSLCQCILVHQSNPDSPGDILSRDYQLSTQPPLCQSTPLRNDQ